MESYSDFLNHKDIVVKACGFEVDRNDLNPMLYDFQKDIVRFALMKGRSAIFAECGLGKTPMQLEWAKHVANHTGKPVLILAPLAVAAQTQREGYKFHIPVTICETRDDVKPGVNITNYEKMEHFVADDFSGVVLDESSILKSFTSKTRYALIDMWAKTPYKLCCTATPAPNDHMELGNHSEFLGIMTRAEMLAMYFVHDGSRTSQWRLKGHAVDVFWQWMASWSVMITNPIDLGYHEHGYDLPNLHIHEIIVDGDEPVHEELSLTERRQARKDSLELRCQRAADLVNNSDEQWICWCDLNNESKTLTDDIQDAVEVKGSDKDTHKKKAMLDFANSDVRVLVTKPKIAGFGMNWQSCHNMVFVGLSDSFEAYYQAVRRCYRFGQEHEVHVYIIISAKEGCVKENIERKQSDALVMQHEMLKYTKEITKKELRKTSRLYTPYNPTVEMKLPHWEEFVA